jgi:hypothetical protein
MAQPDIIATYRTGLGYLSTTFSDPTDLSVIYRKWIFGDGVVVEGSGLQSINHTYYYPGEYTVTLVAQTSTDQYSVNKPKLIIVDEYKPLTNFVMAQSLNHTTGSYWRFYFDQDFHLVFEDNNNIFRSKEKVGEPGKWLYVEFNRSMGKMKIGSFSYYVKYLEVIRLDNNNPFYFSETRTDILPNSTMKMDEFRIWSVSKDTLSYYTENRGRAGYLDTL